MSPIQSSHVEVPKLFLCLNRWAKDPCKEYVDQKKTLCPDCQEAGGRVTKKQSLIAGFHDDLVAYILQTILKNDELGALELECYCDVAEKILKTDDFMDVALEYIQVAFPVLSKLVDNEFDKLHAKVVQELESEDRKARVRGLKLIRSG